MNQTMPPLSMGPWSTRRPQSARLPLLALGLALFAGCRNDMYDQPRYEPLNESVFFRDGQTSRLLISGTVARGQLRDDDHFYRARVEGKLVADLPEEVTFSKETLERGQLKFQVFCSPCHGTVGDGDGMIVRRGFSRPPSLHEQRLRDIPIGHFYEVITNGFGAMYSYASRIKPEDRWAIAAYVRALQLSQNANVGELSDEDRKALEAATAPVATSQPSAAPHGEAAE